MAFVKSQGALVFNKDFLSVPGLNHMLGWQDDSAGGGGAPTWRRQHGHGSV